MKDLSKHLFETAKAMTQVYAEGLKQGGNLVMKEQQFDEMVEQFRKEDEVKHTPTPWRVLADGYIGADNPPYKTNKIIAEVCSGNIADKEFIVKAVNSHAALLEAAKTVSDGVNTAIDNDEHWTRKQLRDHLFALQSVVHKAIDQASK